jgi:hypothetical protein
MASSIIGDDMTDEELLDRITKMVRPPGNTASLDPIWMLIREHRQVGWRRRFTASKVK